LELISVENLFVSFGKADDYVEVIKNINFNVNVNERIAILGPSGCGKSTLLKSIIGLNKNVKGNINFSNIDQSDNSFFGYVPQTPALFNWLTVEENILFPLKFTNIDQKKKYTRLNKLLNLLQLKKTNLLYPKQLSGGMMSRVAIARALITKPKILLLDESFSGLDEITREKLYVDISEVFKEIGTTIIFVTHSVFEAVYLSDRILVLSPFPGHVKEIVINDVNANYKSKERYSESFYAACNLIRSKLL